MNNPFGVAVDGAGNVYIADDDNGDIKKWTAANSNVTTLVSGLNFTTGVAVDGAGNLYFSDSGNSAIKELPNTFADPTLTLENGSPGNDSLPVLIPVTANLLLPQFAPSSDQSWLTITGITNGVVSFAFLANPSLARTAHIYLLGKPFTVLQVAQGPPLILAALPWEANGVFQFAFGTTQNASFTVLSTTNSLLPFTNWTVVGTASNIAPNLFLFSDTIPATNSQRFYTVCSN